MAAERACELSEKPARVVPSTSQQAGLLVLLELDPAQSAAENGERLDEALGAIATGGVAPAARDDGQGRFRRGDAVGFAGRRSSPGEERGAHWRRRSSGSLRARRSSR